MAQTRIYRKRRFKTPPLTPLRRLFFALLAGLTGVIIGAVLDVGLTFIGTLMQPHGIGLMHWLMIWVLGVAGFLAGLIWGPKAAYLFSGLLHPGDDRHEMSDFWLRCLVRAFALGMLLWLVVWFLS